MGYLRLSESDLITRGINNMNSFMRSFLVN